MTNPYGPWATAIDIGGRAQLSSFWRQRLTMLVPASQTSPVLSRPNLLGLVAAAAMVCALPTFLAAPAIAEQEKVSQEKGKDQGTDVGAKDSAGTVSPPIGNGYTGGTTVISSMTQQAPEVDDDIISTPIPGLRLLMQPRVVKQLALTAEEKKKLRAMGPRFEADQEAFFAEATKKQKLSGDQLTAAYHRWQREADKRALKDVETILTPPQVLFLRETTLAADAYYRLMGPDLVGAWAGSPRRRRTSCAGWTKRIQSRCSDT